MSTTKKKPLENPGVALSVEDFARTIARLPAAHYVKLFVEHEPDDGDAELVAEVFESAPQDGWKTCGQMRRHGPDYADYSDRPHPADVHEDAIRCSVNTSTTEPEAFARLLFALVEDFEPRTP